MADEKKSGENEAQARAKLDAEVYDAVAHLRDGIRVGDKKKAQSYARKLGQILDGAGLLADDAPEGGGEGEGGDEGEESEEEGEDASGAATHT